MEHEEVVVTTQAVGQDPPVVPAPMEDLTQDNGAKAAPAQHLDVERIEASADLGLPAPADPSLHLYFSQIEEDEEEEGPSHHLAVSAPADPSLQLYLSQIEDEEEDQGPSRHLAMSDNEDEEDLAISLNEEEEQDSSEESDQEVEMPSKSDKMRQWEKKFLYQCHRHKLGPKAMANIHNLIKEALTEELDPTTMGSYYRLRLRAIEKGIAVKADVWLKNEDGPGYVRKNGLTTVSLKLQRQAVCVRSYVSLKDVREFAMSMHREGEHPDFDPNLIVLALDGVPESRSNSGSITSLEVIVVRFKGCRIVWPLEIFRARRGQKFKFTQSLLFDSILDQAKELAIKVDYIVADAPLRALLRSQVQHTGYFSCDLCEWMGERAEDNKKQVYTSASIANSVKRRTHQSAAWIFANFERLQGPTKEATDKLRLGYREPIPSLLRVPSFDIIKDIPVECLHLLFAGVVKKLVYRTFKMVSANNQASKRIVQLERLVQRAPLVKLPSEFSRGLQGDPLKYKALQFMCLSIIAFPLIFQLLINPTDRYWPLDSEAVERVALWMRLCYLLRSTMMDDQDFQAIEEEKNSQRSRYGKHSLLDIQQRWYIQFQHQFGKGACSYNIHLVGSHLLEIRKMRSMTETSAFPFESEYGSLIKRIVPGTRHVGKQALVNTFLAVSRDHHSCQHKLKFNLNRKKVLAQDYLIYDQSTLDFYALVSQTSDHLYKAVKVKKSCYRPFNHFPEEHVYDVMDWELLAVYKYEGEEEDEVTVNTNDIKCKAAIIQTGEESVIVAIPMSWLALS